MTLEEHLARAICEAFWRTAEEPRTWERSPPMQREVWNLCAKAAIEAGREYRKANAAPLNRAQNGGNVGGDGERATAQSAA